MKDGRSKRVYQIKPQSFLDVYKDIKYSRADTHVRLFLVPSLLSF